MFRSKPPTTSSGITQPVERVTSVLGQGINWQGSLRGKGGVRIEGNFEGQIGLNGILVVGESGKVTCPELRATTVVVLGAVNGNITAEKLDIRATGRVWGNVHCVSFTTEEGSFLRGQVTMEEKVELDLESENEEQEP